MIYFLKRQDGLIKIGTTKQFSIRIKQLEKKYGALQFVAWQPGDEDYEKVLHNKFMWERVHGEWFEFSERLQKYIDNNASTSLPPPRPSTKEMPVSKMWQIIQEQRLSIEKGMAWQKWAEDCIKQLTDTSLKVCNEAIAIQNQNTEYCQKIQELEKQIAELSAAQLADQPMLKSA